MLWAAVILRKSCAMKGKIASGGRSRKLRPRPKVLASDDSDGIRMGKTARTPGAKFQVSTLSQRCWDLNAKLWEWETFSIIFTESQSALCEHIECWRVKITTGQKWQSSSSTEHLCATLLHCYNILQPFTCEQCSKPLLVVSSGIILPNIYWGL